MALQKHGTLLTTLQAAFPWAAALTVSELTEFAAELQGRDTADWPATARQHHQAAVVSYWRGRANKGPH